MYPRLLRLSLAKIKVLIVTVVGIIIAYLIVFHIVSFGYLHKEKHHVKKVKLHHIIVHLDFKGSPPKLSYLESLLPLLKKYNVNGLLMEYEDMFPYQGKLANLSARNSYNRAELKNFLQVAVSSGFEIIPLIQTFGHLEYALKLPEFKDLREMPLYPDSLCPSRKKSMKFLVGMLEQVITFHKKIAPLKHLHIGCDEVYHMNRCEHCSKRNQSDINLFLTHIGLISKTVKYLSPHTTILAWDDMFKNIIPNKQNRLGLSNILPVYWDYKGDNILDNGHKRLFAYQWAFGKMWVASAFKGADGPTQTIPNMRKRYVNHLYWLNVIQEFGIGSKSNYYKFEGIILTGWSRYSHMQAPCELLPASIPSLMLNLILIEKFRTGKGAEYSDMYDFIESHLQRDFNVVLECKGNTGLQALGCSFEGSDLYMVLRNYVDYKKHFARRIGSRYNTNLPEDGMEMVNLKQGYINMNHVTQVTKWCLNAQRKLAKMESKMRNVMSRYFDKYVVEEYVFFKLDNMKKDLDDFVRFLNNVTVVKVWHRRPINMSVEWDGSNKIPFQRIPLGDG